ncbi:unnamed protein product [Angiostrongylus costaricensis]|uniref:BTB domain-containing protein n=1 Tax=Angiostrongylus costaricensis TaxID=334426 RepID=A0A0R3PFU8_ANGCS|nr:unnamed protein product [Angiostrongylus costaricensis]
MQCFRNDELCDVVLEACGHGHPGGAESESAPPTIIAAHKVVLAASCPYFRFRFCIMSFCSCVTLKIQCYSTVLLSCLSSAMVGFPRFLLEQLDATNCLGIASFAQTHNCTQLAHAAQMYTHQHFRLLIESEELLSMDEASFIELISDDRLTTEVRLGEETVFEAVVNWVKYDPSRRASLPRYRKQPLVRLCGLIMVVGGQAPKAISSVDTFDPDSQRWNSLAPLQQRRCRCGVVKAGDLIYAIGGFNGTARIKSVEIYDPRRDLWLTGPFMEARRSTLGVAVLDGCIVAVGGFDGSTGLCSAEMLDPRQGQWMALPSMTTRRSSVGVAAMNGVVYAVGGYDGQSRQCLNSVELYDTRANRWRIGEPLLEVRSGAGVAIYRDRLIAAGGHDGPVVRATMLSGDGWMYLPEMSVCRRNAVIAGFVFALGGDDGTSNLSSVECLEVDGVNQCWNTLQTEMQQARSYCGVTLLPKI